MKKILFAIFLTTLFFTQVYSEEIAVTNYEENNFDGMNTWKGITQLNLSKEKYDSNENITGSIIINNLEDYPLVGANIIIQIIDGEYNFPSEISQDNIIYETVIKNIWVPIKYNKEIEFSLPNVGSGEYRVNVYVETLKTDFRGNNVFLRNPLSKNFSIPGEKIEKAIIFRPETVFNEIGVGQNIFLVEPEEKFSGIVDVKNLSNFEKQNLVLEILVCKWSISNCDNPENKIEIPVGNLKPNAEKKINVNILAPKISQTYELNLKLKNNNTIESIYKNRFMVNGNFIKISKVFLEGIKSNNFYLTTFIENSIDDEIILKADFFENTSKASEKTITITKEEIDDFITKKIEVSSKNFDEICLSSIYKNQIMDKECFKISIGNIIDEYKTRHPDLINVVYNYNEKNKKLGAILKKDLINAFITLVGSNNEILFEKEIQTNNEYKLELEVDKINLKLIIDDLDAKQQQSFDIILDKSIDVSEIIHENDSTQTICQNKICLEGFVCNGESYDSIDGICCYSECTPQSIINDKEMVIPLIFFIASIILIITLFIIYSTYKRVRK